MAEGVVAVLPLPLILLRKLLYKILTFLIMHSPMLNPCWVLHNNSYLILLPMQVVTLILPALSLISLIVLTHQTM